MPVDNTGVVAPARSGSCPFLQGVCRLRFELLQKIQAIEFKEIYRKYDKNTGKINIRHTAAYANDAAIFTNQGATPARDGVLPDGRFL